MGRAVHLAESDHLRLARELGRHQGNCRKTRHQWDLQQGREYLEQRREFQDRAESSQSRLRQLDYVRGHV